MSNRLVDVRRERLIAEELETRPAGPAGIGQQRADPVAGGGDSAEGEVDLWTVRIVPVQRNPQRGALGVLGDVAVLPFE